MKKTLEIVATYCKGANNKVIQILEKLPDDQLKKDMHAYFKSLSDTFLHMTMADANWLLRLKNLYPTSALLRSELLQTTGDDLKARMERKKEDLFLVRRTIDELYLEFITDLSEGNFDQIINYQGKTGDLQSNELGNILLHLFNHQTHHRGAISAMLDMQGIENDYSGLMKYLPEKAKTAGSK